MDIAPHPHASVINDLGGTTLLARHLGLNVVHTTGKWPSRGIPIEYWPQVVAWAAQRGQRNITIDVLVAGKVAHGKARADARNASVCATRRTQSSGQNE